MDMVILSKHLIPDVKKYQYMQLFRLKRADTFHCVQCHNNNNNNYFFLIRFSLLEEKPIMILIDII